jgi:hypothetical protein
MSDVHSYDTTYRTDDWWKAAVTHSYGSGDLGVAVYLWHKDEDWTRRNKYNIKTAEAWRSDKHLIEQYLRGDGRAVSSQEQFPVSDYYNVSQGKTALQTDEWGKAVNLIDQKGSYEAEEIIIYLWQQVDGNWRRR